MARPFADVTPQSDPVRIHAAIASALTAAAARATNPYALSHYFGALQRAEEQVNAGATWRAALVGSFSGRLLDRVLKAINEPKSTREENRF